MHVCHLLETALDAHWPQTGSHSVDIRRISTGGIYDFPALVSNCTYFLYLYGFEGIDEAWVYRGYFMEIN